MLIDLYHISLRNRQTGAIIITLKPRKKINMTLIYQTFFTRITIWVLMLSPILIKIASYFITCYVIIGPLISIRLEALIWAFVAYKGLDTLSPLKRIKLILIQFLLTTTVIILFTISSFLPHILASITYLFITLLFLIKLIVTIFINWGPYFKKSIHDKSTPLSIYYYNRIRPLIWFYMLRLPLGFTLLIFWPTLLTTMKACIIRNNPKPIKFYLPNKFLLKNLFFVNLICNCLVPVFIYSLSGVIKAFLTYLNTIHQLSIIISKSILPVSQFLLTLDIELKISSLSLNLLSDPATLLCMSTWI